MLSTTTTLDVGLLDALREAQTSLVRSQHVVPRAGECPFSSRFGDGTDPPQPTATDFKHINGRNPAVERLNRCVLPIGQLWNDVNRC